VSARSVSLEQDVAELISACYQQIHIRYRERHTWAAGNSSLELRLYKGAPPCSIFAPGEEMFVGLFGVDKLAVDTFQLQFRSSSEIGGQIRPQFERLWEMSGPSIDLNMPVMQWGYSREQ
jgi:hypothetical protein